MTRRHRPTTQVRLLTVLFLKRFLDNDLVSPGADRHESLSTAGGLLVSVTLFATVFLSLKYLTLFIPLPGEMAIAALSDRLLYVSASLLVSALVALLAWDGLGLEPRDGAVLGHLPIRTRTFIVAKAAAIGVCVVGFGCAFNGPSILLHPTLLLFRLRVGVGGIGRVLAAHAATVLAAAGFGFLVILTLRELARTVLGDRWFARCSPVIQATSIVVVSTLLLLLPALSTQAPVDLLSGSRARAAVLPPLWFVGAYETAAGDVVAEAPITLPRKLHLPPRMRDENARAMTEYAALVPAFRALARVAMWAVPALTLLAALLFVWNGRRLAIPPAIVRSRPRHHRAWRRLLVRGLVGSDPSVRAGFFFTTATLFRSPVHRLALTASAAAGGTAALLATYAAGVLSGTWSGVASTSLLMVQPLFVFALVGGFRYATDLPAHLPANWIFHLCDGMDRRRYIHGCKRAALIVLVIGPAVTLLPVHAYAIGLRSALLHMATLLIAAAAILDVLFVTRTKRPFAHPYVPPSEPKRLWPAVLVLYLGTSYALASAELYALTDSMRTAVLLVSLMLFAAATASVCQHRAPRLGMDDCDESPERPTLRLGLSARMGGPDA